MGVRISQFIFYHVIFDKQGKKANNDNLKLMTS